MDKQDHFKDKPKTQFGFMFAVLLGTGISMGLWFLLFQCIKLIMR